MASDKINICADCQRHVLACRWMRYGKPVPGWTAVENRVKDKEGAYISCHITACPLYVRPDPKRVKKKTRDEDYIMQIRRQWSKRKQDGKTGQ